jgi:putative PIG3 family NAD(P)H quinone oxidoreductase
MKAVVFDSPGGPETLHVKEVPDPKPGPGQVLVQVKAAGLNRADLLQRRGLYPSPKGASEILGLECSGVVAELGPGATAVERGDRVMALLPGGGYAELAVVPDRMAIPLPEPLSFEQGAAIPEAFLTAREALFTLGRLAPSDFVLIHAAAGGVGSAAVELAHHLGAHVLATAGNSEKLARARELGADTLINYKTEDFAEVALSVTHGRGVDVVLDFVGASYWPKHRACMAVGARLVAIGVLGGANADVNFAEIMSRRYQILGLVMRSRPLADKIAITSAFIRESLPLFVDGRLSPVIDSVFPLASAAEAHARMEQNANLGKIILVA